MASKYWIKLYHEILDDPKMGLMSDRLFRRTIEMLLMAGEYDEKGTLPKIGDMAWRLRMDTEMLETDLVELANDGIVQQIDGKWIVANFEERQEAMQPAEKMRRKRIEDKKETYYHPVTEPVTVSNTDKIRIDTDKDIDKEPFAKKPAKKRSPRQLMNSRLCEYFSEISGIPVPKPETKAQKSSFGTRWSAPIFHIMKSVEDNEDNAMALIDESYKRLAKNGMTISSPQSLINTCDAIIGEVNKGRFKKSYSFKDEMQKFKDQFQEIQNG